MAEPAGAAAHASQMMPPVVIAGFALIAAATLAGAFLALRGRGPRERWLAAAAGALLVIALLHLLPDAWSAARGTDLARHSARSRPRLVRPVRGGRTPGLHLRHPRPPNRRAHRGAGRAPVPRRSALALAASITVTAALTVHALAEGIAAGTLLAGQSRRQVSGMLAVMCLSPAAGAIIASSYRLPAAATPVLLALAAGVLAHAAWISLATITRETSGWRLAPQTAAVMLAASAVTALAVRAVG